MNQKEDMTITIDLLRHSEQLVRKKEADKIKFFDPIRKKYIIATPEETVRQLLLVHFLDIVRYPKNKIAVEKMLLVNTMEKRFDLLVYDEKTNPFLIVECKAPSVKITDDVFIQAANYNFVLRAPFLLVTNGQTTYCCAIDFEAKKYTFLTAIPNNDLRF